SHPQLHRIEPMTDRTRIKIAAAITALFLAGISAAGLAAQGNQPQTAGTSTGAPAAQRPDAAVQQQNAAFEDPSYDDEGDEEVEEDE
ncbi:MAG: hypothetical protein ACXWDD_12720, partial [Aeromicrobium sp.]